MIDKILKKLTRKKEYLINNAYYKKFVSTLKLNQQNLIAFFIIGIPFFIECFIALNFNEPHFKETVFNPLRSLKKILEAFSSFLAIYILFITTTSTLVRKLALILWILTSYIPTCLDLISVRITGIFLSNDFMFAIFNTHVKEALYVLKEYLGFICINLLIFYLAFCLKPPKHSLNKKHSIYATLFFVVTMYNSNFQPFNTIITSFNAHLADLKESEELNKMIKPISGIQIKSSEKQTYVFVIGESVDRKHMGIYGYNKNTTPCFEKIKDELFIFKDVMTAHVATSVAVKSMMIMRNHSDQAFSLLSFFKSAGFKTFWFSNQGKFDNFDNSVMFFGKSCNEYAFIYGKNATYSSEEYNITFKNKERRSHLWDENLLEYYAKALNDPAKKKLIILHLNGSHCPIDLRYPPEFKIFSLPNNYNDRTKAIGICLFDNSIAYTDYILSKIIEALKQQNEISAMLYLSDHGQDIYDTEDCILASRSWPNAYEIPFVVWVSNKYRQTNSDFIKNWNTLKPFVTNKTAYTLVDLAQMTHPSVDLSYSIFSK